MAELKRIEVFVTEGRQVTGVQGAEGGTPWRSDGGPFEGAAPGIVY